jgi:hypothetical protein
MVGRVVIPRRLRVTLGSASLRLSDSLGCPQRSRSVRVLSAHRDPLPSPMSRV